MSKLLPDGVVLSPHIKAGETKANSFAFGLSATSNKRAYLTIEELEWFADNSAAIRAIVETNRSTVRSASERKMESGVQRDLKRGNAKLNETVGLAQLGQLLQQLVAQQAKV